MVELTQQQWQELNTQEPIVIDPRTQETYVLVPQKVYDRIKGLLYDDSDWTPEEQLRLLAESGQRAGWDDPAMDVYDNYDENRSKLCQ
jgi:hypothetical protein